MSESSNDPLEALIGLIRAQLLDVNTAIPGTIVSYFNGLASIRPNGKKRFADGDALDYPVVAGVRVCWPSFAGGAAGIKGPVKAGDRCLLVFSQQAVDGTDDRRMFDLQDAYAVMCDLGRATGGDSANNNDMTMYFGSAYIRLSPSGALSINAPGGTTINSNTNVIGTMKNNNTNIGATHTHSGVTAGGDSTGTPNA